LKGKKFKNLYTSMTETVEFGQLHYANVACCRVRSL